MSYRDYGVTIGHFTLTDEQPRFKAMPAAYPRLMPFWDFEQGECDIEVLRSALGPMSSGEEILSRFLPLCELGRTSWSLI